MFALQSKSDERILKGIMLFIAIGLTAITYWVATYRLGVWIVHFAIIVFLLHLLPDVALVGKGLWRRKHPKPAPTEEVESETEEQTPEANVIARTRLHWFWRFGFDAIGYGLATVILVSMLVFWRDKLAAQILAALLIGTFCFFPARYLARATIRQMVQIARGLKWFAAAGIIIIGLTTLIIALTTPFDATPYLKAIGTAIWEVVKLGFHSIISTCVVIWVAGGIKLAIIWWDWTHTWVRLIESANESSDVGFDIKISFKVFMPDAATAAASNISGFRAMSAGKILGYSPPWCTLDITYSGTDQPIAKIYGLPRQFLAKMGVEDPTARAASRPSAS